MTNTVKIPKEIRSVSLLVPLFSCSNVLAHEDVMTTRLDDFGGRYDLDFHHPFVGCATVLKTKGRIYDERKKMNND